MNVNNLQSCVTVVVLTYNRMQELVVTLTHMSSLREHVPIMVVDNGSEDGTADVVRERFPYIKVIKLGGNLGAAGRNVGVAAAGTPYVALCDDDCYWTHESLARAIELLDQHPDVAVITARVLVGRENREDPTCTLMADSPLIRDPSLPGVPVLGFLAGASIIRKSAFLQAGGFEHRLFLGGEERLLALDLVSAGWHLIYVDKIVAHHYPSRLRDANARCELLVRNALWVSWLRRPWQSALLDTLRIMFSGEHRVTSIRAFVQALRGVPWILRHRQVVPSHVEHALCLLDDY